MQPSHISTVILGFRGRIRLSAVVNPISASGFAGSATLMSGSATVKLPSVGIYLHLRDFCVHGHSLRAGGGRDRRTDGLVISCWIAQRRLSPMGLVQMAAPALSASAQLNLLLDPWWSVSPKANGLS
jgi:hypothetical protein